jgi:hypothetical protein
MVIRIVVSGTRAYTITVFAAPGTNTANTACFPGLRARNRPHRVPFGHTGLVRSADSPLLASSEPSRPHTEQFRSAATLRHERSREISVGT